MSTRGAIGRLTSKPGGKIKFFCRYHHWDSYPKSGLGSTLFQLRNGYFKGDTNAMLKVLIDEHPAGWSTINGADFSITPGYLECSYKSNMNATEQAAYDLYQRTPKCFCHGDRNEEANVVTQKNASGMGCEYVYAFTPGGKTMLVLSSFCNDEYEGNPKMIGAFGCGDPKATWKVIGEVDLDETEPTEEQWGKIPIEQAKRPKITAEQVANALINKVEQVEKETQKEKEDEDFKKSPLAELIE